MLTEFAERFTRLRQDRGYTQQKAAEKLGVTPQAVSKWENGSSLPDAEMIRSIAQLMDCTTDYLLNHQASTLSQRNLESVQRQAEIENVIQKPILALEVGMGLVDMLVEENNNNYALIHKMRLDLGYRMGIIVPTIQLRDNITLGEKEYRILLHGREVVAPIQSEYPRYFYALEDALPTAEWRTVWPQGEWREKQETVPEGYVELSAMECIVRLLSEIILQHYDQILNRQLTADMVDMTHRRYPAAVEGVVPQQVSLALLQQVLAGLVAARVPINRLDYIIGYLEEHPLGGMKNILTALGEALR
ncbi:MAG: helix-turn-helix domain-containing protein [Lachnospiraceae bacterium]|nr:helix-turn-helix domain-containing protein [Lachnospiraceae bacterium]